jgi:uncharacterized protein (DUF1501 family)
MNRRSFLQLSALAGLAVSVPLSVRPLRAATPAYGGPYWVFVNAGGAWDPTCMFNPTLNAEHTRKYTEIKTVGTIPYAPIPVDLAAFGLDTTYGYETILMSNEAFLTKFGSRLTVINGVDTSTNNHDSGTRAMGCGRIPEGYPSLGALVAAAKAPDKPVAYLSAGGYDATQGLVPLTRVASPSSMRKLAAPNRIDPNNDDNQDTFHTQETLNRIRAAQAERLEAMRSGQQLPRLKAGMNELYLARQSDHELATLEIPTELIDLPGYQLGDLERFMQQAQLALGAFKSGLAVSANLHLGGFDTHANHDRDQARQLTKLLGGINFLMDQAAAQGIGDKLIVVAASDFGRGPHYNGTNDNAGKDHWPVTSVLAMGPGIPGNRLIGATDDAQKAKNVDPGSLQPVDGDAGVKITPSEVHLALRKMAGLEGNELAARFPLLGEALPLFG